MKILVDGRQPEKGGWLTLRVFREPSDPRFNGTRNDAGESRLLYHLKNLLNGAGLDLIKKLMWKDGHLVTDEQHYLRSRRTDPGAPFYVAIYNGSWAVAGAHENFNQDGETNLVMQVEVKDVEKWQQALQALGKLAPAGSGDLEADTE